MVQAPGEIEKKGLEHYDPLYGMYGSFKYTEERSISFFVTTMTHERFNSEILIADEGEPSINRKWNLEEIFQREVDWLRVTEDIVDGYLMDPESLVYFNAITVVMTPLDPNSEDDPIAGHFVEFEDGERGPRIEQSENDPLGNWFGTDGFHTREVVGLQLTTHKDIDFARLRWSKEYVSAYAVDGQHRLASIREWNNNEDLPKGPEFMGNRIPVIMVLPHPNFDFKHSDDLKVVDVSRRIFSNLNRTAKEVDEARSLVLDDKDLAARFTSSLLTENTQQISDGSSKIPLTCVVWKDSLLKLENTHHLNSTANLYKMIKTIVAATKDPPKGDDHDEIVEHFRMLAAMLRDEAGIVAEVPINDEQGKSKSMNIVDYYHQKYCMPTNAEADEDKQQYYPVRMYKRMPKYYVERVVELFIAEHREYLVGILTEVSPYKALMDYYMEHDLITGDFGGYEAQTKKHQEALVRRAPVGWLEQNIMTHKRELLNLKRTSNANLLWQIIWQRAVVYLGKELISTQQACGKDEYIGFINKLCDNGLFGAENDQFGAQHGKTSRVWDMIVLKPVSRGIIAGDKSEKYIMSILRLWWHASKGNQKLKSEKKKSKKGAYWYKEFNANNSDAMYHDSTDSLENLRKSLTANSFIQFYGLDKESFTTDDHEEYQIDRLEKIIEAGIVDLEKDK